MKKNLLKLGALALVVALTVGIAACAQPTEEASGPAAPAIIRLYLDRDQSKTLNAGDTIKLRAGELLIDLDIDGDRPDKDGTDSERVASLMAPDTDPKGAKYAQTSTVIEDANGSKKYFESSELTLADPEKNGASFTGTPIIISDLGGKNSRYVDIELVNLTAGSVEQGQAVNSGSVYLELEVVGTPTGGMDGGMYMYTQGKSSFNDWQGGVSGSWKEDNKNVKKVSLHSGINEIYLTQFSNSNVR